jgi:hypothetical protein
MLVGCQILAVRQTFGRRVRPAVAALTAAILLAATTACADDDAPSESTQQSAAGQSVDAADLYGGGDPPAPPSDGDNSTPSNPSSSPSIEPGGLSSISPYRDGNGRYLGPWADYGATLESTQFTIDAIRLIEIDCMQRLGYDFEKEFDLSSSSTVDITATPATTWDAEWGPFDLDHAREYGYRSVLPPVAQTESPQPRRTHPPGFSEALDGAGGCEEIASDLAHQGVETLSEEEGNSQGEFALRATQAAHASPDLRPATADWSACMAQKGFDYADPSLPQNAGWPGDVATQEEKETAAADVECKIETDFIARWDKIQYDAEDSLFAEYLPIFERSAEIRQTLEDNALAIIAGQITLDDSPKWPALRDS